MIIMELFMYVTKQPVGLIMTLKLGIYMWPISSNNIPTQQLCKQQQIALGNQFINKLNVPITT